MQLELERVKSLFHQWHPSPITELQTSVWTNEQTK